jgi:hypothetical protein
MRFTVNRGDKRQAFDRPLGREQRREMALTIKRLLFQGKAYRIEKARGAAALAAA